eukprot:57492-Amphidinium_carterae.1
MFSTSSLNTLDAKKKHKHEASFAQRMHIQALSVAIAQQEVSEITSKTLKLVLGESGWRGHYQHAKDTF